MIAYSCRITQREADAFDREVDKMCLEARASGGAVSAAGVLSMLMRRWLVERGALKDDPTEIAGTQQKKSVTKR